MLLRNWRIPFLGLAAALLLAACGNQATPEPTPTRTPRPTFTPTPQGQVANNQLFQTPTLDPNQPAATEEVILPTDTPAPPTDTPVPVTDTPAPTPEPTVQPAAVFSGQVVNVRSGPGTSYGLIGRMNAGQRYPVTGKNPDGSWWQIDYSGQTGWVTGSLVTTEGAIDGVQVATNIPAAPPRPTARPTAVPVPTSAPVATQPPARRYEFNIAIVQACRRQPAGNWFNGTVYKGGSPSNGHRVVFSYAPDAPPITSPQISGPHAGYESWNPGYYSHIINAPEVGPKAGRFYVWIVDANGVRISEIADFQTTGPGEGCNEAVVDFDSR